MFEGVGDCLIGARMGKDSGLFAADFDLYKHGAKEYMQALSDKGLLTNTQVHTTQSGGIHMLYRSDSEFPNVKPHLGVEIKGEGGYIIVPPSRGYAVQSRGIAYADPALIAELMASRKASASTTVDALKRAILSGKAFHDPLTQIAARRSAQGWPVEKIQQELLDTLRASAASDSRHPRHSRWQGLVTDAGEELSRIVGSGNDKFNPQKHTDTARDTVNDDLRDAFTAASAGLFTRPLDQGEPDAIPDEGILDWPFAGAGYFSRDERDLFDQNYVAYPAFAENESVLLAAEPKAGKTAIALKLAMQVSSGLSLGENFKVTEPRPVLYFTLEGARAVELRVRAELDERKEKEIETPDNDMLFVVDRPHNFASPEMRDANGAKIVLHNEMCKQEFGSSLGLIVIDTLTKAMAGKDQNSVEDTSELFELIGFLRTHGVTATIVFIHHLSKQGNVRGSTNIEAEVDVVFGVRKDKKAGLVYMDVWRARSMDEEVSYAFKFDGRYLGTTKQGHKLHAPVVRLVEPDIDTTPATAVAAARYAKAMDALVSLGRGTHPVADVVNVLADVTDITPPTGKRPNYKTRTLTDSLNNIFNGQINWSYGNWILRLEKDDGIITAVSILRAE
jgi:KaiC/GvpD/RAD55 family RecA-like ATPase